MAWLGESFANLKGQISSFTKEVLTEGREEDEEFAESDDLRQSKKLITDLEQLCDSQRKEIEKLHVQNAEFQEKSEAQDRQSKSVTESYDRLLHNKEEENKRLRDQIENLLLKQQQQREQLELAKKEDDLEFGNKELANTGTNTDEVSKCEVRDAETLAESPESVAEEILDDRTELEERCCSYQNDLFLLREELMTLQHTVDEREIENAKLNEEILSILHAEFMLDGQSALRGKKLPQHPFADSSENIILSALRQLASIWRDLAEKKATLERTVTKLSVTSTSPHAQQQVEKQPSSPRSPHGPLSSVEEEEAVVECDGDGMRSSNTGTTTTTTTQSNFFPLKVDLFGLETIIEDERGEDDNRLPEAEHPPDDRPSAIAFIHKPKSSPNQVQVQRLRTNVPLINSSCQTEIDAEEKDDQAGAALQLAEKKWQEMQAENERIVQNLTTLQSKWSEKERDLVSQVSEREEKIKKLESELERLRSHLVDLEEQATNDALQSEEQEKQLKLQLAQLQSHISQSLQEQDKFGDVKEEVNRVIAERDSMQAQNVVQEDQIQKLSLQLQNLHFVLEQFQKEKGTDMGNMEKMFRAEINQLIRDKDVLSKEIRTKEDLLEKARSGLEAAQQLNSQIEEKTKSVALLRNQVQEKETEIAKLNSQIKEVGSNLDGKVDRYLLKNLVVGYFSTPADKRKEVLRVIATVLDFNREDRQKTGLEGSSLWPFSRGGDNPSSEKQSLSEAFIRFLENESQPKIQVRIPSEEMARRNSRSSSSSTVPGESPIPRNNSPSASGGVSGSPSATTTTTTTANPIGGGGISEISMSLPVLNQADRSNSILKDVLNPKP